MAPSTGKQRSFTHRSSSNRTRLARHARKLAGPLSFVIGSVCPDLAISAQVAADELSSLRTAVAREGFVAVQVNLAVDVPLITSGPPGEAIKAKVRGLEERLTSELAGTILPSSVWSNGLGQVGVYASSQGLDRLVGSGVARSFGRDHTREMRRTVLDLSGALAAVEARLQSQGYADVQVLDNLEHLEFELPRAGASGHRATAAWRAEAARTRPAFISEMLRHGATHLPAPGAAAASAPADDPVIRFRVDWNAYRHLLEHPQVRAVSLLTGADGVGVRPSEARPVALDPEALAEAEATGAASVSIDLHRVFGYTPLQPRVPARAWAAQASAIDRAFDEILRPLAGNWRAQARLHPGFASLPITLPAAALQALYRAPDPRIAAIRLNKLVAVSALKESTVQINVPQIWTKYSTGAGQSIAILDSGVDASHPFLQDRSKTPPTSKVWAEGCMGTSSAGASPKYTSLCPTPWVPGTQDSFGPGTAAPYTAAVGSDYLHGTHVAGIAAGDGGPGGMRGVAPGARIIAAKITSRNNYTSGTGVASDDVAEAMKQVGSLNDSKVTVNMSIATTDGGLHASSVGSCDNHHLLTRDWVASLIAKGIPVVAATGNDGAKGHIGWPACVSGVIKVGAIYDDAAGQLWLGTNLPYPDKFVGPFVLAPGAGIESSLPGGRYGSSDGTSMSAPHVAGLFALAKATMPMSSVADLIAWFVAYGLASPALSIPMPNTAVPVSFPRIRLQDKL